MVSRMRHGRFDTQDPGEAAAFGSTLLTPHRLRAKGRAPFAAAINSAPAIGSVTVGHVGFDDDVAVESSTEVGSYFLMLPLCGELYVSVGEAPQKIPVNSGCVVGPSDRLQKWMTAGTRELVLKIPPATLHSHLGVLCGRPVGHDVRFDLTAGKDAHWINVAAFTARTAAQFSTQASPRAVTNLESALLTALLFAQPNSYDDELRHGSDDRYKAKIESAANHVRSAITDPLDVCALAAQHGLTTRQLQDGFRRLYGVPPTTFLRDLRLDEAHRRLLHRGTRSVESVSDIAYGVGFTHLGRFSGAYRQRFGVTPSATIALAQSG